MKQPREEQPQAVGWARDKFGRGLGAAVSPQAPRDWSKDEREAEALRAAMTRARLQPRFGGRAVQPRFRRSDESADRRLAFLQRHNLDEESTPMASVERCRIRRARHGRAWAREQAWRSAGLRCQEIGHAHRNRNGRPSELKSMTFPLMRAQRGRRLAGCPRSRGRLCDIVCQVDQSVARPG